MQQAEADLQLADRVMSNSSRLPSGRLKAARTDVRVSPRAVTIATRNWPRKGRSPAANYWLLRAGLADAQGRALVEAESQLEVLSARTGVAQAQTAPQRRPLPLSAQLTRPTQTRLQQLGCHGLNADGTITIKAPIAGTIADRDVTWGNRRKMRVPLLMTIVDNRTVLATANIFEKKTSPRYPLGSGCEITGGGQSARFKSLKGKLHTVGSVVDGETRVVPVQAELDNAQGTPQTRYVCVPGGAHREHCRGGDSHSPIGVGSKPTAKAWCLCATATRFEPVEVTLGRTAGDQVEVLSGLFEGDEVVTQRA